MIPGVQQLSYIYKSLDKREKYISEVRISK